MTKYYEALGVNTDASQEAIQSAFERRVKQHHPDQSDAPNAAQQFMRIKEAYDILSDPDLRDLYDELGHDVFMDEVSGPGDVTDSDIDGGETTDWQSYTRGTAEAEYIWDRDTDHVAEPIHGSETSNTSVARQLAGYGIVAVPISFMTMVLLVQVFSGSGQGTTALFTSLPTWLLAVLIVVLSTLCVVLAEIVLDTDRRVISTFK